jgi:anti-sigma regulatory factor (Ser/Thr protein kinase)
MFLHKNKLSSATHIERDFLFSNDSKVMYSLLNEIVSFVKIHFPSETYEEKISNCKQALIELLTNAVKHSNTDTSSISVVIEDHKIELIKLDKGRPFYLEHYTGWPPINWPLSKQYIGEKIKIYNDDFSHLHAIIQNENRIAFELEEFPIESVNLDTNLIEHYGLLILTKVSDQFYYVRDSASNTNIFHVTINI